MCQVMSSYFVAYLQYIMISYDYYLCLSPYFVLVIASSFPNERAKVSSERRECVEVSSDVFWFPWDDSMMCFDPSDRPW